MDDSFNMSQWLDSRALQGDDREATRSAFNAGYTSANYCDAYGGTPVFTVPSRFQHVQFAYREGWDEGIEMYNKGYSLIDY